MSTTARAVMDAICGSATKREAAAMLGITAVRIGSIVRASADLDLVKAWTGLPADGAFAGMSSRKPNASSVQHNADMLVAEACADSPIDARGTQREEVVLLLLALANIVGSLDLPRGWVRAVIQSFEAAGYPSPPTPASLRWYRARLACEPEMFLDVRGADPVVMSDLIDRARR